MRAISSFNTMFVFIVLFIAIFKFVSLNAEEKVNIIVAVPYRVDTPFDEGLWYTEEFIHYIESLLPEEQYSVSGYFVSLNNIPQFLNDMEDLYNQKKNILVLNFCDGGEWDGYPGISVIREWEKHPISALIPISGGDSQFIYHSDDKSKMNDLLQKANIKTFPQTLISSKKISSTNYVLLLSSTKLNEAWPLFCKLNMGWGASGISGDSICHNLEQLVAQMKKMHTSFPNSDIIIQPYLPGPEYTVLILKDQIYAAVRRDYHNPYNIMHEDYLSGIRPVEEEISYSDAPKHVGLIALKAIQAIPGKHHYTRVDLRDDAEGNSYVLDINDRPGFGNHSTVDYMLQYNHQTSSQLLLEIINSCRKLN
jgi:D-alanine-D-alanine ligase-like ATP-grasp enzyme